MFQLLASIAYRIRHNWQRRRFYKHMRKNASTISSEIAGVQPMAGPTGLIFTLRSRYQPGANPQVYGGTGGSMLNGTDPQDNEAGFSEARTGFSGDPLPHT